LASGKTREPYIQKQIKKKYKQAQGMGGEHHVRFIYGFYMENTWTLFKEMLKILYRWTLAFGFSHFT
jgi:hypothetical protein